MDDGKYFSHSWALLTRDKGWIKPVLVMSAANLVPIAGPLGNKGYALEWARLTAWGVDSSPKQKGVDVGKCIGSGWRAFVVDLGWILCYSVIVGIITAMFGVIPGFVGDLLLGLLSIASLFVSLVAAVVLCIAEIRTAIYESIGAGYRIDRVFQMIKRDTSGMFRVVLINFLGSLIIGVATGIVALIIAMQFLPAVFMAYQSGYSEYMLANMISQSLGGLLLTSVILGFALSILTNIMRLVLNTATALWMRQFDVPNWGKSEDPLPEAGAARGASTSGSYAHTYDPEPWADRQQPGYEEGEKDEPPVIAPMIGDGNTTPQPTAQPEAWQPAREDTPTTTLEPAVTTPLPHSQAEAPVAEAPVAEVPTEAPVAGALDEDVPLNPAEKNVDELYADLYDVIRRNNHVGEDDE